MNLAASGSEDDDPLQEARAYNQSIYFMVVTPYLLLGTIGFLVYRGYRSSISRAVLDREASGITEVTEQDSASAT